MAPWILCQRQNTNDFDAFSCAIVCIVNTTNSDWPALALHIISLIRLYLIWKWRATMQTTCLSQASTDREDKWIITFHLNIKSIFRELNYTYSKNYTSNRILFLWKAVWNIQSQKYLRSGIEEIKLPFNTICCFILHFYYDLFACFSSTQKSLTT